MKKATTYFPAFAVILVFFMMALASVPPKRVTYSKPVSYPCIHYPPLTYSPILIRIDIDANYNMKDLTAVRASSPPLILNALYNLNSSYKLADGVTPNLVLHITYTNDGYDHFGMALRVDWQGQASFNISLPTNYVTLSQLITDMAKEFNVWVVQGWHSGNCN